jgi:hypothetical protein
MTVLIRLVTLPSDNSSSLKIPLVHARHSPGDERKGDCRDGNRQSPHRIHAGRHRFQSVRLGPAFGSCQPQAFRPSDERVGTEPVDGRWALLAERG